MQTGRGKEIRKGSEKVTKKMVFEATHRHIFINQKPLISVGAVTKQGDEIRMVEEA